MDLLKWISKYWGVIGFNVPEESLRFFSGVLFGSSRTGKYILQYLYSYSIVHSILIK